MKISDKSACQYKVNYDILRMLQKNTYMVISVGAKVFTFKPRWQRGKYMEEKNQKMEEKEMNVISMKQLLEAGVHFGHQTRRWNPKMAEYIYTERNGIYIIDLQKSVGMVDDEYNDSKLYFHRILPFQFHFNQMFHQCAAIFQCFFFLCCITIKTDGYVWGYTDFSDFPI